MTDIPIVTSPLVPPGTMLLVPSESVHVSSRARQISESPWLPNHTILPDYQDERRKGLDALARMVDAAWESMGEDPDQTWRAARLREKWSIQRDALDFRVVERVSLSVINPASSLMVSSVL